MTKATEPKFLAHSIKKKRWGCVCYSVCELNKNCPEKQTNPGDLMYSSHYRTQIHVAYSCQGMTKINPHPPAMGQGCCPFRKKLSLDSVGCREERLAYRLPEKSASSLCHQKVGTRLGGPSSLLITYI